MESLLQDGARGAAKNSACVRNDRRPVNGRGYHVHSSARQGCFQRVNEHLMVIRNDHTHHEFSQKPQFERSSCNKQGTPATSDLVRVHPAEGSVPA